MRSKPLALAAKLAVSAVLVGFLVKRYGGEPAFRAAFLRLDPASFLLAEALIGFGLVLSALRWLALLRARGVTLGFGSAVRLYFVGYFFNLFLPTTVGGDVARALGAAGAAPMPILAGVILVERIVGFGCLLAVGIAASYGSPQLGLVRPSLWIAAAVYVAGVLALVAIPSAWETTGKGRRWLGGLLRTAQQVRAYGFHPAAVSAAIVLSLGWQLALALANAALAKGLGGVAPLGSLLALIPVIQAVGMIPVSFGGLGVREMGYEFFFRQSGFDPAGAVALAACFLGVTISVALVGGVLYLVYPFRGRAT
ncbi:MAG: lysylphosphatidylglycerol synthase transmembrane domain-containing protein [bacterium]